MKTGRNLQEVLVELNRQNKAKQDFISPAQGMRLREDGHTFEINHLTTSQQEVFGTRTSQDVVSYDRATTLEGIGWQVATMEPQQWKQINQ